MSPTIFEDKAPNVAAAIIILVAISAVVFPLRIYTRIKHKAFGWDDFTMCCAAVSSSTLNFLVLVVVCMRAFVYLLLMGLEADLLKRKTGPIWSSQCLLSWSSFSGSGSTQVESR